MRRARKLPLVSPSIGKVQERVTPCECNHAGRWCWTGQRRGTAKHRPQTEAPEGRKGIFDGRNVCQKCFCVTFDESNKAFAVSGTSYFHRERTCD